MAWSGSQCLECVANLVDEPWSLAGLAGVFVVTLCGYVSICTQQQEHVTCRVSLELLLIVALLGDMAYTYWLRSHTLCACSAYHPCAGS